MDWSHLTSMWVGLVPGCTSAHCVLKPGATRPTFWSTWSQNTSLTHLHTVVHSVIGPSALRQRSKLTKVPTIGTTEIFYNKFTLHIIVRYMLVLFSKILGIQGPESFEQYLSRNEAGCYVCGICSHTGAATTKSKRDLLNHVESKHFPNTFTYNCPFCEKTFGTFMASAKHKSNYHK